MENCLRNNEAARNDCIRVADQLCLDDDDAASYLSSYQATDLLLCKALSQSRRPGLVIATFEAARQIGDATHDIHGTATSS